MINVVVGKPGQGKTLYLVKLAAEEMDLGRDVYSNFYINRDKLIANGLIKKPQGAGNLFFWKRTSELIKLRKGLILIDECQIYFNSRSWKTLPPELQYKFQQHRKHGLDIWGAVQNLKRIDTVVRELVNTVYEVHKMGRIFRINGYDVEEIDKANRKGGIGRIFLLRKKLYECYDTMQEIASDYAERG